MTKIQKLPEIVINQIAAGEVVENPASIVKELIENSLDAKAKKIEVEIVAGGHQLIKVEDDGCGMDEEDALLSLDRHATSKIRSVDDLQTLQTMGFRGEALAAISSVSEFEMKTCDQVATQIVVHGGQILQVGPCARNRGTTMEVKSLFYNVPARKKFQKSIGASTAHVSKVVETLSLAHPQIEFKLVSNGKLLFQVKKSSEKERIQEVLGEFAHEIKNDFVSGFVSAPDKAMTTRIGQYLFINRRPIFSPLVSKAVKEAYGTMIGEHSYPPFVLFLNMSPDGFDVNVHPQKKEVRFREDSRVFQRVLEEVVKVFSKGPSFFEPISFTPTSNLSFQEDFFLEKDEMNQVLPLMFTGRPLGVFGKFLLMQEEKLILLDLQGAHFRILFETLHTQKGQSQSLIWPLEVDLYKGEEEIVEELCQVGIECRRIGEKRLAIDALPPFLEASDFPIFLESFREKKKLDLATFSFCRRLKKNYSVEQANAIWQRLKECKETLYDPLGNIIWKEVEAKDLEGILQNG